jgi:hypothetical protein
MNKRKTSQLMGVLLVTYILILIFQNVSNGIVQNIKTDDSFKCQQLLVKTLR